MASDLAALIARLREVKAGSRELDGLIMVSADPEMNAAARHQASLPFGATMIRANIDSQEACVGKARAGRLLDGRTHDHVPDRRP